MPCLLSTADGGEIFCSNSWNITLLKHWILFSHFLHILYYNHGGFGCIKPTDWVKPEGGEMAGRLNSVHAELDCLVLFFITILILIDGIADIYTLNTEVSSWSTFRESEYEKKIRIITVATIYYYNTVHCDSSYNNKWQALRFHIMAILLQPG